MIKILLILFLTLSAIADTFKVDTNNSNIEFSIVKFFFLDIDGVFTRFDGDILLDKNNTLISINGVVDARSADMGDKDRDEDLRDKGYLDSMLYPNIYFDATSIKHKEITAKITIKKISKDVIFKVESLTLDADKLTLHISSTLKREDFMLNGFLSSLTSNDIKLHSKLVAYRKN